MKLLLIEDELELSFTLKKGLKKIGYAVDCAYDGLEALDMIDLNEYDLLILDLNIPKLDGISVLNEVRKLNLDIKILILSANSDISTKIQGLDLGANDYLTKPFDFYELTARIRALLRRNFSQRESLFKHKNIKVDLLKKLVFINNISVDLTAKEFSILEYLITNKGKIISSENLIEHVWDSEVDLFSNTLKFHISSLRKKLNSDIIQTIRGQGYVIR